MFIWRTLKPITLVTVLRALHKGRTAAKPTEAKADGASLANLRFANPCDPNSLT